MARENGLFGWNLFGNKTQLGERPKWETFAGPDQKLQAGEQAVWQQAIRDWEEKKNQQAARQDIYTKMAQNVGEKAPAFTTSMPKRETPPNMMTSLFPSRFGVAGAGPVDILAPEVESIDDLYRKRPNMFRTV